MKIEDLSGIYYYDENSFFHREDGPAVIFSSGEKRWYRNGKLHRDNGPAIECSNGSEMWYVYGKCHRLGGPAMKFFNDDKYWFYQDEFVPVNSQDDFERFLKLKVFI